MKTLYIAGTWPRGRSRKRVPALAVHGVWAVHRKRSRLGAELDYGVTHIPSGVRFLSSYSKRRAIAAMRLLPPQWGPDLTFGVCPAIRPRELAAAREAA